MKHFTPYSNPSLASIAGGRFGSIRPIAALCCTGALFISLVSPALMPDSSANAWAATQSLRGDVKITVDGVSLDSPAQIPNTSMLVNMAFRNTPLSDALRALARKGGFNVVVDESVQGNISVDLFDVTLGDALETLKTYGGLIYHVNGNTLMAASGDSARAEEFRRAASTIIPLKYANSVLFADVVNRVLFNQPGSQQITRRVVTPDFQTNSLIAMGTLTELELIKEVVHALDRPREMKTWRLSHAQATEVASLLSASIFNESPMPAFTLGQGGAGGAGGAGGGGGAGGAGGIGQMIGAMPGTIRLQTESIEEGTGSASATSQGGGGGGGTGGGQTGNVTNQQTVRRIEKEDQQAQVSALGPIIIPDTRLNTITILGTAEHLAMADAIIPTLDRKLPQVVIEASVIEMSESSVKEMGFNFGLRPQGALHFGFGSNNTQGATFNTNNPFTQATGLPTDLVNTPTENLFQISSNPIRTTAGLVYQINALMSSNKAKLLANPTIVATHESESIISIVDEIVKSVVTTIDTGTQGPPTITSQANIGEAGITLNILPKIAPNGLVTLRVRPSVTSVRDVTQDQFNNVITLLSKREAINQQVTLHDGESLVLGGLVQETDNDVLSKLPILGDLPIVGALARNSARNKTRSELIIVITPHIVEDDGIATARPSGLTVPASKAGTNMTPQPAKKPHIYLPPLQPTVTVGTYGVEGAPDLDKDKPSRWRPSASYKAPEVKKALDENDVDSKAASTKAPAADRKARAAKAHPATLSPAKPSAAAAPSNDTDTPVMMNAVADPTTFTLAEPIYGSAPPPKELESPNASSMFSAPSAEVK